MKGSARGRGNTTLPTRSGMFKSVARSLSFPNCPDDRGKKSASAAFKAEERMNGWVSTAIEIGKRKSIAYRLILSQVQPRVEN